MATLRRSWFHSRGIAVLAALCLVSALAMAAPASATTPGKNGRIAFKGYLDADNSTGAIFTVWPDGSRARQITFPAVGTVDDQPDWSPDGSLIAFRRCVPDTVCAIYTVRPNGTHLRRLSPPCLRAAGHRQVRGRVGGRIPPRRPSCGLHALFRPGA